MEIREFFTARAFVVRYQILKIATVILVINLFIARVMILMASDRAQRGASEDIQISPKV